MAAFVFWFCRSREMGMRRMWLASAILTLSVVTAVEQADAQSRTGRGAVRGAAAGALIGGVAGGGRGAGTGALIGAATGALIARNGQRRHGRYYWYRGNCYYHGRSGNWYRAARHRC
jgi:uncharacterized protein YqgC (DUF456 family)